MSFGYTVKINPNQIAREFGKVTLIKLPYVSGYGGKAVMVASRYVNNDSFWVNPNWTYKIKSGKYYSMDYAEWAAEDLSRIFNENVADQTSFFRVERPVKLIGEIEIDFN